MPQYYFNVREKLILIAVIILSFLFLPPLADGDDLKKISLAILPFEDLGNESLNMHIPALISIEVSKNDKMKVVPLEAVKEKLYEIEPSYMWAERKRKADEGGIVWSFTPKTIVELRQNVKADYVVYGDVRKHGSSWKIDCMVNAGDDKDSSGNFSVSIEGEEDLSAGIKELAEKIAGWILKENALKDAEEDIRSYLGGLYSHGFVIERMRNRLKLFPDSVPVRALLLDLLRKDKGRYQDQIVIEGSRIMDLIDPSRESETRYLLSLSLDPFDLVAGIFELRNEWPGAIEVRRRALSLFPVRTSVHEIGLGRNYYRYAMNLEAAGRVDDALKNYKRAVEILGPSSEFYEVSKQGVQRLAH